LSTGSASLASKPHRVLGQFVWRTAITERGAQFELTESLTPRFEFAQDAVGAAPNRGALERLQDAIAPSFGRYLGVFAQAS